ncbi:peptide MFS transporter [Pontibacter sp. BT310]|uniref:Peptide MFS transporter n=1 Tax=Pontibacter populi TaxID=890055 RepID=A0ABS6XCQ2_9BACT|nr:MULTISPECIES: peptide MFS transporter [Pontibacter]MBJ6118920.1 peptide MFS transporter [Pontibacter sp. BT310]MBR0571348.1 peptide MFS transporter [Microvirga sp. STS03]MBW3365774.1 peptide MFS transporter [Pontibacter populi]
MDLTEPKIPEAPAQTGHPKQLYMLFFAEMWERFSFYGMKALLLAYMVTELKFDEPKGYAILGSYAALVYTMPLFGGVMADKYLGYRKAVLYGGILMSIGHLVLAVPEDWSFFLGMAFIICGNGFFKPNISSLVGTLYADNDPRKDSGFSIFYMGINIGAALGGLLCGYVGQQINWHYGFGMAGIFMILGLVVFVIGSKSLNEKGLPPDPATLKKPLFAGISTEIYIYAGSLLVIPVIVALFHRYELMDLIMFGLGAISLAYILYIAFQLDSVARNKLFAALVLIIFSTLFWAFYEQNAGSLNLFAMRNVDMHVAGMELPSLAVNNFLPPAWVIVLSFFFAWLWPALNRRGMEPSTPLKFGLSFVLLGLGFCTFYAATVWGAESGLISLPAFIFGYFFIICGELCISPIGLSMVTKLAPTKIVAMMMGIWFFASAIGEFLAGKIGALMSVPEDVVDNPVLSLPYYADIISKIGIYAIGFGILLILLGPVIRKWMADVR